MRATILYTVDGKQGGVSHWASLCRNINRSTVRSRLMGGVSTLAELDAPRGGHGYTEKEPSRAETVDAAINDWPRLRRARLAQLVALI